MVEKVTITISSELTQYGEVVFSVKSHMGIFKSKCLHDALSDADIKMTGITDMVDTVYRQMKSVNHFALETKHTRLYDREPEESGRFEPSSDNNEPAVEVSVPNISSKCGKSTRGKTKKAKHLVLECV